MALQFRLFPKEVYEQRRAVLMQSMGEGLLLFLGNEESSMNYRDNWYPFRQDSSFLYYFGLDTAGLAATIDLSTGNTVIYGNELTIDDIVWTGPLPSIKEMAAAVGVTQTAPYGALAQVLAGAKEAVHYLPPYRPENRIRLAEWLGIPVAQVNEQRSLALVKAVIAQRSHKDALEIAEMHQATLISGDMHLAAMRSAKVGMKEYEIVAKVKEVAYANNGQLSFSPIVTVHGETLHNVYSGNTLKEGDLVLCDAGASNDMNYAGDLTCTFPAGKKFTSKQKEVYEIVLGSHRHAVSLLKPGVLFRDVYWAAAGKLVEGLKGLGLMKGDVQEAVMAGAHAMFFQCGLGHMIGLDVHDMEDLGEQYVGYTDTLTKSTQFGMKSLRLGRALEPGFTLTVEPGLYFIPELMDLWKSQGKFTDFINYPALDAYRDFSGIRVEEDYHITATGAERLGKALPMDVEAIEELRRG